MEQKPKDLKQQPLTLQQHCFLCLLAHLEEFPTATLALLPRRMRHELLFMLPPADILQLEQTSVVEGVDMDEFWEVVGKRYRSSEYNLRHTYRLCEPVPSCLWSVVLHRRQHFAHSWKDRFVAAVCSLLLHFIPKAISKYPDQLYPPAVCTNYFILLEFLFCTEFHSRFFIKKHKCLPIIWDGHHLSPKRFSKFLSPELHDHAASRLLNFVMKECQLCPRSLFVDCNGFAQSCMWKEMNRQDSHQLKEAFKQFVQKVEEVDITARETCTNETQKCSSKETVEAEFKAKDICHHIHWILETILSTENPALHTLSLLSESAEVRSQGSLLENVLKDISPLFVKQQQFLINTATPYHGLRKLKISGFSKTSCVGQLVQITHSQQYVESIHYSSSSSRSRNLVLQPDIELLCSLFRHNTIRSVHLENLQMDPQFVQEIIQAFLLSPFAQKMVLKDVPHSSKAEKVPSPFPTKPIGQLSSFPKSLHLVSVYISSTFHHWLTTLPPLTLDTLELSRLIYANSDSTSNILNRLCQKLEFHIEAFELEDLSQCSEEGLTTILHNPTLQTLKLGDIHYNVPMYSKPSADLLDALSDGLRQQARIGTLRYLSVNNTSFVSMETNAQHFFDALFQLPQLPKLTVDFNGSYFQPDHLRWLYKAWQENTECTVRLKKLNFHFGLVQRSGEGFPQSLMTNLCQIAVESDAVIEEELLIVNDRTIISVWPDF